MFATRLEKLRKELPRKGRQEGLREGQAAVLLRQLTRRFGSLCEPLTERVRTASSAELEQWLDNFVDARTLDDVFRSH